MRVKRLTVVGRIDSNGELQLPWEKLKEFGNLNKDRAVIVRTEVQPKEPSEKLRNFVFGYAIPEMQRILYDNGEDYTKEETYQVLRGRCPVFLDESFKDGMWHARRKEWEELDSAEAVEFVAWLQRYAAVNYCAIISDPE